MFNPKTVTLEDWGLKTSSQLISQTRPHSYQNFNINPMHSSKVTISFHQGISNVKTRYGPIGPKVCPEQRHQVSQKRFHFN